MVQLPDQGECGMNITSMNSTAIGTLLAGMADDDAHMRPIFEAVRDDGLLLGVILAGGNVALAPRGVPAIAIIGDDVDGAKGPAAFPRKTLQMLLGSAEAVVLHTGAATPEHYARAVKEALRLEQTVVIIESRTEQELAWLECIRKYAPVVSFELITPNAALYRPEGEWNEPPHR
jgi:hypothetical protein